MVKLSDFSGKNVVLAFYPGAFTSVCEKELCTFRDSLSKFNRLNAVVLGISVDSPFANKAFAEEKPHHVRTALRLWWESGFTVRWCPRELFEHSRLHRCEEGCLRGRWKWNNSLLLGFRRSRKGTTLRRNRRNARTSFKVNISMIFPIRK